MSCRSRTEGGLIPTNSQHSLAVMFEHGLALQIVCSRYRVVMPTRAVGLDDEVLIRPTKVRHDRSALEPQQLIHLGQDEASADEEVMNDVLELGAGRRGPRKDLPKRSRASHGTKTIKEGQNAANAHEVQAERLTNGSP